MPWRVNRSFDEDFGKGAVEAEFDAWGSRGVDSDGQILEAVSITEDVVHADPDSVVKTEYILGADEDGTPG
ncbi:MAG TPA: hypothetical protein VFB85_20915 [Vicinamibacterales bacterium]|jgi:hypothetical protein|nr:hypothetical protein [Vicinamibacterales bacterium]